METSFYLSFSNKNSNNNLFTFSNSFRVKFDFEIPKKNLLSIFLNYGEIESFKIIDSIIYISYYNFLSSMKMYNEFNFNCLKLKQNNIEINFINYDEFFQKFFISVIIESKSTENLILYSNLISKLFLNYQIYKIYMKIIKPNKIQLINQFIDLRQKEKIEFILNKLISSNKILIKNIFHYNKIELNLNILNSFQIIYIYSKSNNINSYNSLNHLYNFNFEKKDNINEIKFDKIPKNNSIQNLINQSNNFNGSNDKKLQFTGIKKRNTSHEERKKYKIIIEDIINEKDQRTTIMLKNIPRDISQLFLMSFQNNKYKGKFNFLYLPIDFVKKINVSYAFLNLKNSKDIIEIYLDLHDKPWSFCKNKNAYISYARIQGFKSISEHFSKSNLINNELDKLFKPYINDN